MFNKSLELRSNCGALVPVGEVLQEMVDRAAIRQSFYRPKQRISPVLAKTGPIKKMAAEQLELFHMEHSTLITNLVRDPERPLLDLVPEFYV